VNQINFQGNPHIHIEVKYLKRARRLTIRILGSKTVRVTAPLRTKEAEIQNLLSKYSDWILKKYQMIADRPAVKKIKFINGEILPLLGEQIILKIIDGKGAAVRTENELIVSVPLKISNAGDDILIEKYIRKELIKWYQSQALEKLLDRVPFFSNQIQAQAKSITLKNYKSRWGSCSSKGDLIFNWQIITFNQKLFDYVVAHEVCHLKQMNHSEKFYQWLSYLGFQRSEMHKQMRNVVPLLS
jgi:predicted metal-dependent hydrolase